MRVLRRALSRTRAVDSLLPCAPSGNRSQSTPTVLACFRGLLAPIDLPLIASGCDHGAHKGSIICWAQGDPPRAHRHHLVRPATRACRSARRGRAHGDARPTPPRSRPIAAHRRALYPLSIMLGWLQAVAQANPLTYEVHGMRQLLLGVTQGGTLWVDFAVLAAFLCALAAAAARAYPRAIL